MKKYLLLIIILVGVIINSEAQKVKGAGVTFVGKVGIKSGGSCFPMLWMCKVKKIKVKCKIALARYSNAREIACKDDDEIIDEIGNERFFYVEQIDGNKMPVHFLTPIPTEYLNNGYFEGSEDVILDSDVAELFGLNTLTLKAGKYLINDSENSWGFFDIDVVYS